MNLRELIFTQSQADEPSQSQVIASPEPAAHNSKIRASDSDTDDQIEESKQGEQAPATPERSVYETRKRKNGEVAKSFVLPVYHHAPRVQQRMNVARQRADGARMPVFAPGLLSDLSGLSKRRNQKEELRHLWHRCYFGKDFEGAAMTLGVLAEIDPVAPHDVTSAAHLLRYSQAHETSTKKLVQGVLKPFTRGGDRKSAAIKVSVEMLASIGEIAAARKLLQDNIVDLTYQGRMQLLCYDTVVTVLEAVSLAAEVCRASGKSITCPNVSAILRDPFELSKSIRIINTVRCSATLVNAKVKAKKQTCKLLLQDLKGSFNLSVAGTSVVHDRMGMEELYVAYLIGLEHTSKASRYLANLKHQLPVTGDSKKDKGLQAQYYHLLARYLIRYRYSLREAPILVGVRPAAALLLENENLEEGVSLDGDKAAYAGPDLVNGSAESVSLQQVADYTSAIVDAGYLRVVNALVRSIDLSFESQAPCKSSLWTLYLLRSLHRAKAIDSKKLVTYLCDMIEYSGQQDFDSGKSFILQAQENKNASYSETLSYLLWRCLCEAVGAIETKYQLTPESKILTNANVMKYLSSYSCLHIPMDNQLSLNKWFTGREWWTSSILSAARLDDFQSSAGGCSNITMDSAEDLLEELKKELYEDDCLQDDQIKEMEFCSSINGDDDGPILMTNDLYWSWFCGDKKFTCELRDISMTAQRKMSIGGQSDVGSDADAESMGNEDEIEGEKDDEDRGQGDTPEGKRKKTSSRGKSGTEADDGGQLSQASHDEVEYQSQESEAEWIAVGAQGDVNAAASSSSSSSSGGTGGATVKFLHEILSLSVCGGLFSCDNVNSDELSMGSLHGNGSSSSNSGIILPSLCVKPALLSHDFSVQRLTERRKSKAPHIQYVLGDRLLEVLMYQAIIRAHMETQDNVFTIRVVQIIVSHALRATGENNKKNRYTAEKCVKQLMKNGLCITRALKIADCLASKSVDISLPPAWQHSRDIPANAESDLSRTNSRKLGKYAPV